MTEKLFYRDSHQRDFNARVLSCCPAGTKIGAWEEKTGHGSLWETELDRTAFFPEGGGQYSDHGIIGGARVLDVQEKEGRIFHLTDKAFSREENVTGKLDWEERFMKMQQHTGEHIVSGLVHKRFGYDNVGFHLGSEDCTMDFNGEITPEELQDIEKEANRAVWKNLKVRVLYPSEEELGNMDYRSKIEIVGRVRIVEIPGYDVCACCAPHVNDTGEIGLIKLTGVMRYKGGVRVTMLCGVRALKDYEMKEGQNRAISSMLCTKEEETSEGVRRLRDECGSLKCRLGEMEKKLAVYRADSLPEEEKVICSFSGEPAGEAMRIFMNRALEKDRVLCAVFCGNDEDGYRYVIGSRVADMRSFVKEFNAAFAGKGGGKPEMVQGTVKGREEDIRSWIIEKAGSVLWIR